MAAICVRLKTVGLFMVGLKDVDESLTLEGSPSLKDVALDILSNRGSSTPLDEFTTKYTAILNGQFREWNERVESGEIVFCLPLMGG